MGLFSDHAKDALIGAIGLALGAVAHAAFSNDTPSGNTLTSCPKPRRTRSDCELGNYCAKTHTSEFLFKHDNGRKIRNDTLIGTLRKNGWDI